MKRNVVYYTIIAVFQILIILSYFSIQSVVKEYADGIIEKEADNSWNMLIAKKDSILAGKLTCVLYHNTIPQYDIITSKEKDYLSSYITEGLEFHNNMYIFNPTFIGEEKESLNWLCYTITDYNISKGYEKYTPLQDTNLKGWFQSGWALGYAHGSGSDYICYIAHPYILDFGENENNVHNLREVLDYSYDFYTRNENSLFYNCTDTAYFKRFKLLNSPNIKGNDYWYWKSEGAYDKYISDQFRAREICKQLWNYKDYKVLLGISNVTRYHLELDSDYTEKKKNELASSFNKTLLLVICILDIIVSFLCIMRIRAYHKRNIPFLQRIIDCSCPRKFMKKGKYDKEKLEIANTIYDKALKIDVDDEEAIALLAKEIEEKLGIYLVTKGEIKELRNRCNPKNFMKPYNAEKITKANSIYGSLQKENFSYSRFEELRNEVEGLYS